MTQSRGAALKAPASLPLPPHIRPPSQGRGALAPQEAHWSCWLRPPIRQSVGRWVRGWVRRRGVWALAGTGASPRGPGRSSPLLTLCLLEPPGEVLDAHVLELKQVLQAPHLHLQDLGHEARR